LFSLRPPVCFVFVLEKTSMLGLFTALAAARTSAGTKPHILWVVADDLGYDDLVRRTSDDVWSELHFWV
jgi:hypothetical protein